LAKVRKFQANPKEAAIDEVEPFIPADKKEEFKLIKDMALHPEKYENDPRALEFKRDPVMALLNESEDLVETPEEKQKI
jgi:hypothetical protein